MAKGLRFKDAEKARDEITSEQLKRISKLYNDWADDIAKKAEQLKRKGTMSSELQERQMKELEQALRKASEQVANDVTKTVKEGMTKVCQSVIAENADWMESLGFPKDTITAAFSSVPDNVVRNIITGKIYSSGWSLSQSIWGDNEDTLAKIHEIVAGGMAENKPIYDIAKDLEQYVRPDARKQWNLKTKSGKMIYPKKVDYNAQRLARTLSQHAYQQTIKTTSTENPFIQKVKWHSSGNRVCEICKKRNGKIFPVDKLPMDHPNGFCIMEQLVDDNIDDRLIDWVNGKEDKELDKFAKKLGFDIGDMDVPGAESTTTKSEHKIVQGNQNAINEWHRREGKFDFEIEDAINYQGFDGLPRLVNADEFDKLVKRSNFIAQRTYSANSQEILDAYRDQLYNGKWYVDCSTGGAQYGQGMYCAADWQGKLTEGIKAEMKHYQDLNRDRTLAGAKADYMSKLSAKDVMKSAYMGGAKVSDDEWKAYVKLKSDPNLTLYKLPPDDHKLVKAIQDRGDWLGLGLAVDDMMEEFEQSYKGYSYTETLTLDPSAKVIKYSDLVSMAEEEGVTIYDRESARMTAQSAYKMLYGKNWYDLTDDEQNAFLDEMKKNADFEDIGSYAVLKGYDVINAAGHGESGSYTVILNRTKLVIKKG